MSGLFHPYLTCKNASKQRPTDHFHQSLIGRQSNLDLSLLEYLVRKGIQQDTPESCACVYQTSARAKQCGK